LQHEFSLNGLVTCQRKKKTAILIWQCLQRLKSRQDFCCMHSMHLLFHFKDFSDRFPIPFIKCLINCWSLFLRFIQFIAGLQWWWLPVLVKSTILICQNIVHKNTFVWFPVTKWISQPLQALVFFTESVQAWADLKTQWHICIPPEEIFMPLHTNDWQRGLPLCCPERATGNRRCTWKVWPNYCRLRLASASPGMHHFKTCLIYVKNGKKITSFVSDKFCVRKLVIIFLQLLLYKTCLLHFKNERKKKVIFFFTFVVYGHI